jgi:hypothetical protein
MLMSYYDSDRRSRAFAPQAAAVDAGLRAHMLRVSNYKADRLAMTGIVAYAAAASGFYQSIADTPMIWIVMLAPLALVPVLGFGIGRMSAATAIVFMLYAAAMGLSLGGRSPAISPHECRRRAS